MNPVHRFFAIAAPLDIDNLDTDQIFPARFMSRDRRDGGYGAYFLHDLRFTLDGAPRADFVLNDPRLAGAGIVVAAANYGCGSGRPGAVFSHLDTGIRVVIAESFGPVFSAVAYKSGLLTIELDSMSVAAIRHEIEQAPGTSLTVDLDAQRVVSPGGIDIGFAIDPFVKRIVTEGRGEIELSLGLLPAIDALEARQRADLPWLFR